MSKTNIEIVNAEEFLGDNLETPRSPYLRALLKLEVGQGFSTVRAKLNTIRVNASKNKIGIRTRRLPKRQCFCLAGEIISMKTLLFLPLFLLGCSESKVSPEVKGEEKKIEFGNNQVILIKTVILDGNEYYATKTYGRYYTLCPKLPPKNTAKTP